jgi:uncharacterized repeat protein (TIGR01451 family)
MRIFLLSLLISLSTVSFSQSNCDPNLQWVEYDVPYPAIVKEGKFASVYNDELYVMAKTDSTIQIGNNIHSYHQILKLDTLTNSWQTLNTFRYDCMLYDFEVHATGIYISGALCGINGDYNYQGIARFNGTTWDSIPEFKNLYYSGIVFDMNDFNGNLIIGGTFSDTSSNGLTGIAQFDGSSWTSVGNGYLLSGSATVRSLSELNGVLYVGGSFMQSLTSNINFSIWDGTTWLPTPSVNAGIYELYSLDTCVFAYSPQATSFGSTAAQGVAYYHSGQWYPMNGPINLSTHSTTSKNNQLYFSSNTSGVLTYENGNWKELSSVSYYTPEIIAYKGDLLHLEPRYSCGSYIEGISKLCDTIQCGIIEGIVYVDSNLNCLNDNDGIMQYAIMEIMPGNQIVSLDSLGHYRRLVNAGNYSVSVHPPTWYSVNCPVGAVSTSVVVGIPNSGIDFSLEPSNNIRDLQISLAQGPARPGFPTAIHVSATNIGTESFQASSVVNFSDSMIYDSASVAVTILGPDELEINWGNINVFEDKQVVLYFSLPPNVSLLGQILQTTVNGTVSSGIDSDLLNNADTLNTIVTGAYDPNIKLVSPVGDTTNFNPGLVLVGTDEFTYTIHFQNTGSDTAFTVLLVDTLHQNLDATTFKLLSSSHPVTSTFFGSNLLEFKFNNILLPDSSANLLESQGYVKFKMNTISGLSQDDQIRNYADIYFDFNPPIRTNTVVNTLTWFLSVPITESQSLNIELYPNPLTDVSTVRVDGNENLDDLRLSIFNIQGQQVKNINLSGKSEIKVYRDGLSSGIYVLKLTNQGITLGSKKLLIE